MSTVRGGSAYLTHHKKSESECHIYPRARGSALIFCVILRFLFNGLFMAGAEASQSSTVSAQGSLINITYKIQAMTSFDHF